MVKKILLGLLIVLVLIQFIRPVKNLSGDSSKDLATVYEMPDAVSSIFQRACNDCHSNKTVYPWYAEVQPVGWWLNSHVSDGKRHFNVNEFAAMRVALQKKKLEEIKEQIKDDEMPLASYTWIHRHAVLSEVDKKTLDDWCRHTIDVIVSKYPPDSLILPKQRRN